ncbi:MAG: hypothetical protein ACREMQ_13210, partial [Longimicrobiales bacterium]
LGLRMLLSGGSIHRFCNADYTHSKPLKGSLRGRLDQGRLFCQPVIVLEDVCQVKWGMSRTWRGMIQSKL